jgi:tetratricopeptide (TPR) repeat protein
VVDSAAHASPRSPDLEYAHGVALARLGRFDEAALRLRAGLRLAPSQDRFLLELGAVAFRQQRLRDAARWLRRADPANPYAADFLGSIYFLQSNLEAALKYWNRAAKPHLARIETPPLRLDPVLLDRAFTFAPGQPLLLPDLLATRARLDALRLFSSLRFQLAARPDGEFDLRFAATERPSWSGSKPQAAISTLRGIAWQTIHPEIFGLGGRALNLTSLLRWDSQKRRAQLSLATPRFTLAADARDELWQLRPVSPTLASFQLRRSAVSAEYHALHGPHWRWSSGAELSHRRLANEVPSLSLPEGYALKHTFRLRRTLLHRPEHRMESLFHLSSDTGRVWDSPSRAFHRTQLAASARWFPRMATDSLALHAGLRAGRILGHAPFDELFSLGLERDNDLWMRAHIGTRDGRKGSAPLGRAYLLFHSEFDKSIRNDGLFSLKLSPFLDIGRIGGQHASLAPRHWLVDSGLQAKFRILGAALTATYGKDLRTGRNVFYLMASPPLIPF